MSKIANPPAAVPLPTITEARVTGTDRPSAPPAPPAVRRDPLQVSLDGYADASGSSDAAQDMVARGANAPEAGTMSPLAAARFGGLEAGKGEAQVSKAPAETITVGSRTYEVVSPENLPAYMKDLHADWGLKDDRTLERAFTIKGFKKPIAFANELATVANELNHHPDLHIKWGELKVEITTHDIDRGVTLDDLKLAAAIDGVALPE